MCALTLRSSNQIKLTSTFRPAGTSVWCLNIILASKLRLSVALPKPERITDTNMSQTL